MQSTCATPTASNALNSEYQCKPSGWLFGRINKFEFIALINFSNQILTTRTYMADVKPQIDFQNIF